jgi:FlaA1/EpsC-like NDP-sugar epimerase
MERVRAHHGAGALLAEGTLLAAAVLAAFFLQSGGVPETVDTGLLSRILAVYLPVKLAAFVAFQAHQFSWRHTSLYEIKLLAVANAAGSAASALICGFWLRDRLHWSFYLSEWLWASVLTSGGCMLVQKLHESAAGRQGAGRQKLIAFIYGAGSFGRSLLRELLANPQLGYEMAGFIDDDPAKVGTYVQGVKVLGGSADLKALAVKHYASHVLVAVASASAREMSAIYQACREANLVCRIVPSLSEQMEAQKSAPLIRDISIEDLLGREVIELDRQSIMDSIAGRVVMVTGCAGSIGSAMCRQIARFRPKSIVGYDVAETPLFFLINEMQQEWPDIPFCAEIGSIQNEKRLAEVMEKYQPEAIYHAAAYKHVPMMEASPFEAVANNVFGTETVLRTARAAGVKTFVMISTDKAVRSTNVMGTTKRIAELIVNAHSCPEMKCVSVRFGNVLGSNGSVVPIFMKQIAAGGPVTVTHPEMTRYFMTIPEAAQLVLQASAIGAGGEVMVLEMGDPVKIVDLAEKMITLVGLRPNIDIPIQFTGLRPGEKLYEEINFDDESMVRTRHRKIRVFRGKSWTSDEYAYHLGRIRKAWEERNTLELLDEMKAAVPEYTVNPALQKEPEPLGFADPKPDPDDPAEVQVTVLGVINRRLVGRMVECSERTIRMKMREALAPDVAVSIGFDQWTILGEVESHSPAEDGTYEVQVAVSYRLPAAQPAHSDGG